MSNSLIRSFSVEDLADAASLYPEANEGLDINEWVGNLNNVMLREGDSTGIFAYEYPGLYTGHYFFRVRGKEAKDLAIRMLREMFDKYEAKTIRGLTKVTNRPALWMTRQLGFKSYGVIDTTTGLHEIFCMTADEFNERHK